MKEASVGLFETLPGLIALSNDGSRYPIVKGRLFLRQGGNISNKAFQTLEIDQILPLLASCYETGQLVPFIGAGMSRNKFADWTGFVANLEKVPGVEPSSERRTEVRAQRAATAIRNSHTEDEFWNIISTALREKDYEGPQIPPQTEALAGIYWPLTISTNYDHLLYCACHKAFDDRLPPMVLGRSADDCKQLMSLLLSPFDREVIWHIQGFLGEECPGCHTRLNRARLAQLRSELVIGHEEYRRAANTAIHFRRCFAEVFRSRSFLFLGSSISEDYFLNLFGETLELCGPSPVPHFAFVQKDSIDARFLAEEMNIIVCEYDTHDRLTEWLAALKDMVNNTNCRISRLCVQLEERSSLEIAPFAHLPLPEANSDCAVAIVVRPCKEGLFEPDPALAGQCELTSKFKNQAFPPGERVFSLAPGIFAVRARITPGNEDEVDSVGGAVRDLLDKVTGRWSVLHIHLPAAGGTVPPIYGFIESVRAFGGWARDRKNETEAKGPLHVIAHVGPQVLLNLTSRRISLYELLTSTLIRFSTAVTAQAGREPTRRVLYKDAGTRLADVLNEVLEIDAALPQVVPYWSMSLCPTPTHPTPGVHEVATPLNSAYLDKSLCATGVVFGSVLTLARVHQLAAGEKRRAAAAGS
jgi:hypothetical protein